MVAPPGLMDVTAGLSVCNIVFNQYGVVEGLETGKSVHGLEPPGYIHNES